MPVARGSVAFGQIVANDQGTEKSAKSQTVIIAIGPYRERLNFHNFPMANGEISEQSRSYTSRTPEPNIISLCPSEYIFLLTIHCFDGSLLCRFADFWQYAILMECDFHEIFTNLAIRHETLGFNLQTINAVHSTRKEDTTRNSYFAPELEYFAQGKINFTSFLDEWTLYFPSKIVFCYK